MTPNNHLTGMIAAYVDDLLMSGDGGAEASLFQLGQRLGLGLFGTTERDCLVWKTVYTKCPA